MIFEVPAVQAYEHVHTLLLKYCKKTITLQPTRLLAGQYPATVSHVSYHDGTVGFCAALHNAGCIILMPAPCSNNMHASLGGRGINKDVKPHLLPIMQHCPLADAGTGATGRLCGIHWQLPSMRQNPISSSYLSQ